MKILQFIVARNRLLGRSLSRNFFGFHELHRARRRTPVTWIVMFHLALSEISGKDCLVVTGRADAGSYVPEPV